MLLEAPLRTLGKVDHLPLKTAVGSLPPAAWLDDTTRQKSFEQHKHTQSIVMLFSSNWPDPFVEKRRGWEALSAPANALIEEIVSRHYPAGGKVIRAMAAKLLAGGRIALHRDGHPSFAASHRIHVPLVTNPNVDFLIRGVNHHLEEGTAYEVSNLDYHAVTNRGEDRIHFIFDYMLQ